MKQQKFEAAVQTLIEGVGEDPTREGLVDTPKRVYHSMMHLCSGYAQDPKAILGDALFESRASEMVIVRDIEFYSLCEHHLLPFFGRCDVAYIPNGKVVGLSKIPRMVDVFARRLQIQEQLTEQIADALSEAIAPRGVAVLINARHMCMEMRGVQKRHSLTTTSALRGLFLSDSKTREEFMSIVNAPIKDRF